MAKKRLLFAAAFASLAVVVLAAWMYWRALAPTPELPVLRLDDVDPEVAEAVVAARNTVQQSPRSASAWGRLAMVLHANAMEQGADACYAAAAQLEPRNANWPYLRGYLHHEGPRGPELAIPLFQRAADLSPPNSMARIRLAEMLVVHNQLEEADAEYNRVLAVDARDPDALLGKATIAIAKRDYQEAKDLLNGVLDHPYTKKRASELLTTVYDRLGETERSDQQRQRLLELPSDVARSDDPLNALTELQVGLAGRLRNADILRQQQRIAESVQMLKETVVKYPHSDDAWANLGAALHFTQDPEGAEQAMRKCIEIAPKSAEYRLNLAMLLLSQERFEEASVYFRDSIALRRTNGLAHFWLGECLFKLGQEQAARESFSEALRLLPDHQPARQRLNDLDEVSEESASSGMTRGSSFKGPHGRFVDVAKRQGGLLR